MNWMNEYLNTIDLSSLSETDLRIYEYIQQNSSRTAWMTLEDLCAELYVSNASIVRFCQRIGLKGFNELKYVLRSDRKESRKPVYGIIPRQLASISDMCASLNEEEILKICHLIRNAESFYIYGRNLSAVPAGYMYDMLMSVDMPCILIDWMDALSAISESAREGTVLLMITDHAHKEYGPIIRSFKNHGARVIWLCGSEVDSDLRLADIVIQTDDQADPHHSPGKISALLIVQILIELLSRKDTPVRQ